MTLYITHADTLRSPETAKHHALRIGQWTARYRASQTKEAVRHIVKDMTGHYAPATINRSLGALQKGLSIAWHEGRTPVDYSSLVKRLPENNRRTTYLSMEQVKTLADHASENVRAAIWIALLTGWMKIQCLQISGSRVVQARGLWEWNSPAGYKMASNRQTREWPMEPLI